METEGTASAAVESTEATTAAAVEAPVAETPAEHTPEYGKYIEALEKDWDKIPEAEKQRLNKHFQPAFNRNLNLINTKVAAAVRSAVGDGYQLPEGKTYLDLMTEDGGKGFGEALKAQVQSAMAPITQKISEAEQQQVLQQHINKAIMDNPAIKPHLEAAIRQIDGSADLTQLAMQGNGAGIYYVLQGVAAVEQAKASQSRITELENLLGANKIAVKTANGTTRAGAVAPKQAAAPAKAKTLADAAKQALETYKQGLSEA